MSRSHAAHRQAIKKKDNHYHKKNAIKRWKESSVRKFGKDVSQVLPDTIEFVEEFK